MLTRPRTVRGRPWLPTLALALAPAAPALLSGQVSTVGAASADSALRSTGPAGSVATSLDAFVGRYDATTAYGVGAEALPFLTDHIQLGVGTGYNAAKTTGYAGAHSSSAALVGNYVAGGGPHWRGYAGGYVGMSDVTQVGRQSVGGVQVGGLYFLDPAIAVQAEYQYGRLLYDGRPAFGRLTVGLQPYLFGRAGAGTPAAAGFGMADVALDARVWGRDGGTRSASGTFAPYLTRWLQLGGEAAVSRTGLMAFYTQDGSVPTAVTAWGGTAFARAYLPLGARVQPFAGAFFGRSTTSTAVSRLAVSDYGPSLGVRYFLNARVALDGALERRFYGPVAGRGALADADYTPPAQTTFTVGLATRFGRTR